MKRQKHMGVILLMFCLMLILSACQTDGKGNTGDSADLPSIAEIETLLANEDYASAKTLLDQRLSVSPDDAEAHFQLALVYFNQNNAKLAEEHFLKALELDPSRAPAVHHNLGVLAFSQNDIDTAQQEFMVALELDPNDPDSHYQLGATYLIQAVPSDNMELDQAKLEQAEFEFTTALELEPGKAEPLVGLGNLYLLTGDTAKAIEVLKSALDSHPDMREALFALGRAYYFSGDAVNATEILNKFLETDPPLAWATEAQNLLDDMAQ